MENINIDCGGVYLLHFSKKFHHSKHYIGFAQSSIRNRLHHHRKGSGSKLMAAVNQAGINWRVVRTWPNESRTFERSLKNQKGAAGLCPVCKESRKRRRDESKRIRDKKRKDM